MPTGRSMSDNRRAAMADGAIRLLASGGVHALTHRRLDRELGLAEGSTSNAFPRRIDLLRAALDEIVSREATLVEAISNGRVVDSVDRAVDLFADVVDAWLQPENRDVLIARYTMILEASRSDDLAPLLSAARSRFLAMAESLCSAVSVDGAGPDPAAQLVAWADGVLLAHITASERVPTADDIRRGVRRLLSG